jgi:hypothetical protein
MKKLSQSEAHDYPYRNPEYRSVVSMVEELYLAEDAATHAILNKIARYIINRELDNE